MDVKIYGQKYDEKQNICIILNSLKVFINYKGEIVTV